MRLRVVIAFAALLAPSGCGGGGGEEDELVVFAAASLAPAFERYAEGFGDAEVLFSFAGSDELAAQIRQGVAPDVYAAANRELPEQLAALGLVEEPVEFATNRLVVGVPAGSEIADVSDLAGPGVRVAIGDEDVPVGSYTREILARLEPTTSEGILANVASEEPDVAGIVAKLTQGAVDAGFVYATDIEAAGGRLDAVDLPAAVSPDVAYAIAVSSDAENPAAAAKFVDGLLAGHGEGALADAGFGEP